MVGLGGECMKTITVLCPHDFFVVSIPAEGMVNLADYCPRACGRCLFRPFRAEAAPDFIY